MKLSDTSSLLEKYDKPVPRYTSYPTVPSWKGIDLNAWDKSVMRVLQEGDSQELSLYVHVPFCRSLCSFCGCTKIISRDYTKAASFVETILAELKLKLHAVGSAAKKLKLKELHLGGGTPTWLPPEALGQLLRGIFGSFSNTSSATDAAEKREFSIEVDPRTCTIEHIDVLVNAGVTRLSLGVQDFHIPTLRAIKREQPFSVVQELVSQLRASGVSAINFDLVYGLPYQTAETIEETIAKVILLKPMRIALYSYAHIPELKAAQKGVEMHGLPCVELKRKLYQVASSKLIEAGYFKIGMDHFSLPCDELFGAHKAGRLHRNFMGYTIQKTKLLIGLGPSSLSDSWYAFSQNTKNVADWESQVHEEVLSPSNGHLLSRDELLRRRVILDLMCNFQADLPEEIAASIFADKNFASEEIADGLVECDSGVRVKITEKGEPFVRNICALFDRHFSKSSKSKGKRPSFSKAI